jgi:hypothetical protein
MNSSSTTGYSWTNTSQWSQLPTTNQQTTQSQQTPQADQAQRGQQPGANNQPQQQTFQTPETRRDMITRLYRQILGREPDNAGLNYYLFNSNITEPQIAKEMYESTEHQSILARSKDVREMVLKLDNYNKEINELKTKLLNADNLSNSYKALLDQKTQMINTLQQNGGQNLIQTSENSPAQQPQQQPTQQQQFQQSQQPAEDGLLLDDPFADEGKKGKGCLGWFTSWFKFN